MNKRIQNYSKVLPQLVVIDVAYQISRRHVLLPPPSVHFPH